MAASVAHQESLMTELLAATGDLQAAVERMRAALRGLEGADLGEGLIKLRERGIDALEAVFAEQLHRFDQSGEYAADGALGIVPWLRWKCKLSGPAAAERVTISRQLEELPETQKAFASGDLGYHHVCFLARTADHIGAAAVRKSEASLLKAAGTMDPGQFTRTLNDFEHRVDAARALSEANHAYQRRYFHVSEPVDGLVHLDGLLDAEGGAIINTALNALMGVPGKDDTRSAGQRRADALVELAQARPGGSGDGSGPRPQLVIRTSVETLAGAPGAGAGEIESGGSVPTETVRRLACDAALTRITGKGELQAEISRAVRTIPPATRRALAFRDHGCVVPGCGRPAAWTDAHHLKHWIDGGETTMANLALLCRRHHRMVHEQGWTLSRHETRGWIFSRAVAAHARSA
ncbi:MAG TPA: DUF222 domain-containing protein [Candidatus Dormibacteraeota bacterium]|nr:DUF222 domain-containing protein [Candidatus Dormibacteraeota bacterium]